MYNIFLILKKSSMWLKEMLKDTFSNEEKIVKERYLASKFSFIILSLLFFINFFFVWAGFYTDFFINTLLITYISLLLSIVYYFYYFVKKTFLWKLPNYFFIIVFIFLFIIFWFLSVPFVIEGGLIRIIDFFRLYFNL